MNEGMERWSMNFSRATSDGNDIRNVSFSWENQPLEEVKANMNAFLQAAGIELEVVNAK
jgi:hypothetical protein